jgi:flagellar basal-body rod modification protein FlgD
MGQMTQFTMLEQITNMAQANDKLAKSAAVNGSLALLGHTVTYVDEAGRVGSGKVENVAVRDGAPSLTVGGRSGIDPSAVSEIR